MFDEKELKNLLELSRLTVASEKLESLSRQLEEILGYFERLSAYDTSAVDVDLGVTVPADSRRSDSLTPGLSMEEVRSFSQTIDEDGFFLVPRILGDDHG